MSKVPWYLFQERKPRSHLVVGAIFAADGLAGLGDSTAALALLRRLARKQKPVGDYAAAVMRDAGWPEVYFAFNDETDAKKFAEAVQAELIGSYPGWASQRAFEIDGAKLKELEASLPPPIQPKRPPSYEVRLLGRARRGSRAPIRRYDE